MGTALDLRSVQIGINPAGNRPVFLRQHAVRLNKVLSTPVISLRPDISYKTPFVALLVKNQIVDPSTGELSTAKFKAAFAQESFAKQFGDRISTRFRFPDLEELMQACLGRLITPHKDNFFETSSPSYSLMPGFLPMEDPATVAEQGNKTVAPVADEKPPASRPAATTSPARRSQGPAVEKSSSTPTRSAAVIKKKSPPKFRPDKSGQQSRPETGEQKAAQIKIPTFVAYPVLLAVTLPYEVLSLPPELAANLPNLIIGQRIADIRETRGLKKGELAKAAGIRTSTYTYVEGRNALPNPHQFFAISQVLRVAPEWIIFGLRFEDAIVTLSEGGKILFLRLRHGWTQDDLADKMGNVLTRSAIHYWEQDKSFPEGDTLEKLRRVLEYRDIHTNSTHFYPGRTSGEPQLLQKAREMKRGKIKITPATLEALSGRSISTTRNFLKNHPEFGYSN